MTKVKNSVVSKDVGWDVRKCAIPSKAEAESTIGNARRGVYGAIYNLLEWHRFCGVPENDEDRAIMVSISNIYREVTE
jgi:hypothetical protein